MEENKVQQKLATKTYKSGMTMEENKKVAVNSIEDEYYLLGRLSSTLRNYLREDQVEQVLDNFSENILIRGMQPFNLDAAKIGAPICLRCGRKARIICFDFKNFKKDTLPLAVAVSKYGSDVEEIYYYPLSGRVSEVKEDPLDLVMLTPIERMERWVIYDKDNTYPTKEEAEDVIKVESKKDKYGIKNLTTTKIELL